MKILFLLGMLAQSPQLTVYDAVNISVAQHPALIMADAQAMRAAHLGSELRAARLPQLSFESSLTRFQEPMVVAPLHGFDPQRPPIFDRTLAQGAIELRYTLLDAGRGDRITRADRLAEAAHTQVEAARAQVIFETVRAYLRVRSARELNAAYARNVEALQRERDRASQLVEQGRAARVVVLRAEAALSATQADAVVAQSGLDDAVRDLARLLNRPAAEVAALDLPEVRARPASDTSHAALLAIAGRANPELKRLRLQREAAVAERKAAQAGWWPRLQTGGRFVEYASSATSPEGEWQFGAQLSYALFTGGARGASIERASAEVRAADAEISWGERRVAEAVDRVLTALSAAHARVNALAAAVRQSEEVTRIDRLALDAGAGVQSDYLTAEANLFRVRAALTDARAQDTLARVELARVTGELTPEWVVAHLESVP